MTRNIKLNVDLKQYLDKQLAKDNLKLINQLDKANNIIDDLKNQLQTKQKYTVSQKDKQLQKISNKIGKIYDELDCINFEEVTKSFKRIINIKNLKFQDVVDILYILADSEDGQVQILLDTLPDILDTFRTIENYIGQLED